VQGGEGFAGLAQADGEAAALGGDRGQEPGVVLLKCPGHFLQPFIALLRIEFPFAGGADQEVAGGFPFGQADPGPLLAEVADLFLDFVFLPYQLIEGCLLLFLLLFKGGQFMAQRSDAELTVVLLFTGPAFGFEAEGLEGLAEGVLFGLEMMEIFNGFLRQGIDLSVRIFEIGKFLYLLFNLILERREVGGGGDGAFDLIDAGGDGGEVVGELFPADRDLLAGFGEGLSGVEDAVDVGDLGFCEGSEDLLRGYLASEQGEDHPAVLPFHGVEEHRGGEELEELFVDQFLNPGFVFARLEGDAVPVVQGFVAGEFRLAGSAAALPFFLVEAFEGDLAVVDHQDPLDGVGEHGQDLAIGAEGLDVEFLVIVAVFAEEQPGEGVEEGGLAGGVAPADVGDLAESDRKVFDAFEVGEG